MSTTSRFGITKPASSDFVTNGATAMGTIADGLDAITTGYSSGVFASRPAAGTAGRIYRATDVSDGGANGTLYFDDGTAWQTLALGAQPTRGKSIIATSETRTNTAFGLMTTPDRVQNIVLPTSGLIFVAYQALWQESVLNAASAALFLGSNQIKQAAPGGAPAVTAATLGGTAGNWSPISSSQVGLSSYASGGIGSSTSDVTTGQVVGLPNGLATGNYFGAPAVVFAAAGTYDVSIQFKASSGNVLVKERKLWVWSMGF